MFEYDESMKEKKSSTALQSKQWQPMKLNYLGRISDIVQVGGGKLTPPSVDPGEPRKTRPSG
jgi:hypothetical protein